jgi:DNA repair photolyase
MFNRCYLIYKKMQPTLFDDLEPKKRTKLGKTDISYRHATSILTKTSGFMKDYDFSLNPYSGCSFGCNYCYAAFFTRGKDKLENWGKWVEVKENAVILLRKFRTKSLDDKTIYLSSVTDPYQPIEKELELTREILKELHTYHPNVRLVIQTRSSMITRDIDILKKFKVIQINMTITTDSEEVRKTFEPLCTSNKKRLESISEISKNNIQSCITMTPLLPIKDPVSFARSLKATGVTRFIIQPFHKEKGKFVAGTRKEALEILNKYNWGQEEYLRILKVMQKTLPNLGIGQKGFAPI